MGQAWHLHQNDESGGQNALVMRMGICSFPVTSVNCNVPQFVAQGSGA